MAEVEKKGIGKAKTGLIVCVIVIVILAISSVLLYARIVTLENQVNSLETDKTNLQNQVSNLETENSQLENEIDNLKAPQLHMVGEYWTDNYPLFASINLYGNIFNSGSQTAYNVRLTIEIYDTNDTLLKTREIPLGSIVGKSYETVDVEIEYSGDADYVLYTLTYD